jgi:hypothetical protein
MVTHNANLVVNTDADQIIVAEGGTSTAGGLPPIRYISGGLDEKGVRTLVCNILEGASLPSEMGPPPSDRLAMLSR